ncbi:MAG: hypothetical protein DRH34_03330, partial [Deltaproteobacteria bacterium]
MLNESLSGYRLKILKHHDEYPAVADLLYPDERDSRLLQDRISELAAGLRLNIPHINVSLITGLHDLPRDQRRVLELPLLKKAVEQWAERNKIDKSQLTIQWQPSGKPQARVSDGPLDISLAHDNRYCIVAAASCPLGCDLAPVTHRTLQQWSGLLGSFGKNLIAGQAAGYGLDRRGTALWAAREVLQKLNVKETLSIKFENPTDDSILFICTTDKGVIKIITFWTVLTRGRERVLALS